LSHCAFSYDVSKVAGMVTKPSRMLNQQVINDAQYPVTEPA
jgi:hypothetical protein